MKPTWNEDSVRLEIAVLSGRLLSSDMKKSTYADLYIKLEILGCEVDQSYGFTATVTDNAFNPVWLEHFDFGWIRVPCMAVIRISIYDAPKVKVTLGESLICQTTLPLEYLRKGYR